jgi:hypothetical protein
LYISAFDPKAFNMHLDFATSLYFSTVTVATVGYGDIFPTSTFARVVVCCEIFVGLAYAIFFFSTIASFAWAQLKPTAEKDDARTDTT